jgi:hypothetical protein
MDAALTFTTGDYVIAEVGGEVFLVHPETGDSFRLAGSGPRMWSLLTGGSSIGEVTASIAAETGADPSLVGADVDALATQLVDIGALVSLVPGSPRP